MNGPDTVRSVAAGSTKRLPKSRGSASADGFVVNRPPVRVASSNQFHRIVSLMADGWERQAQGASIASLASVASIASVASFAQETLHATTQWTQSASSCTLFLFEINSGLPEQVLEMFLLGG